MKKTLTSITLTIAAASSAPAATLVDWDFTGLTNPTSGTEVAYDDSNDADAATYASTLAGVTAGDIVAGSSGIYTRTLGWSPGNVASGELNLQNWDLTGTAGTAGTTGGTGDGTPDNWIEFSLTAGVGLVLDLDSISISTWRNGGGAAEFYNFDYSTDGGTNWTNFGGQQEETNAGDSTFRTISFSGDVQAEDLLIRFAANGGSGNIHINGITVEGSLAAVPEPSSTALIGLAGLGFILRRRR